MSLNLNSTTNSPVQTPTGNKSIQGYKSNSSSIHDIKQMLPNQFQQSQQQVPSQFEITSISCTTGNNENGEKSSRFRRVKIETEKNKETARKYVRGRWLVNDYYDIPDSIIKQSSLISEQMVSTNNYATTTSTNNFQTIQNPIQPTANSVLDTATSTTNSNINDNNIVNFATASSLPGINSISNNSLVQDKNILINTSFEPLTTATANESTNNISPPLAKNTEVNSQNENLQEKQDTALNESKSSTLYVPTPISTTNNSSTQTIHNNVNHYSTLAQVHSRNDASQNEPIIQIGPIATNVVIGSKNSVFQTQSVTNAKQSSQNTINQQTIQQSQLTDQAQQPYKNITQPLNQSDQPQSLLQFQPTQYLSSGQNPSDNSVNSNIVQLNAQLNSQQLSNNITTVLQQSNITTHPVIQTSYSNQSQLPAYNSCSTAPILNLNHGQKQPFASQFSSQNVSPKEQNGLTAPLGQTSSISSIVGQMQTSNNILPLTTTASTTSGIKDFLNLASTKTSSSSSSSANDLLSEAYELFNKKPNQDGESEKKNDGIHNRIELAMDIVKSHLTNAVKEEMISLKSHIEKLNEKCSRLEEENRIFRQYVTPEVLLLIDNGNRPSSATNQNHSNTNNLNSFIQTQSTNFSSSTTSASSSSSMSSAMITTNVLNHNISATISPSALSVTDTNLNTSGEDNSSMSELLTPVLNTNGILTTINNNNTNSVFNENSSNMSISCDDNLNNS